MGITLTLQPFAMSNQLLYYGKKFKAWRFEIYDRQTDIVFLELDYKRLRLCEQMPADFVLLWIVDDE